jgi:catechol 2,3-dioxygenase-like lactoylglutathione lyase family enzyme
MPAQLDHLLIPSRNKDAAAGLLARIFDVAWGPARVGPFAAVYLNDGLTIDIDQWTEDFAKGHYCFRVSQTEFDAILGRLAGLGVPYRSLPHGADDHQVNTSLGSPLVYWSEPDGHVWELLVHSYARGPGAPAGTAIPTSSPSPSPMPKQSIGLVSLLVRDYDEALAFYVGKLGFELIEDHAIPEQGKRWVVVAPPGRLSDGAPGTRLLLARASTAEQAQRVGAQTGGRVFLFLYTDDLWRDHERLTRLGVEFVRPPAEQPYGSVAVFKDLYGNLWDLIQPKLG